jgi:hypothetical protein
MPTLTSLVDSATTTNQGKGGDTLNLTGSNLGGTTTVNFGPKAIAPDTVAAGVVTATVPRLCAGEYPVSVTARSVTSNSLPFFAIAVPVVNAMIGDAGPAGATSVTLTGTGFLTTTDVAFGSVGAATGTVPPARDTQLTVTAPAHATPIPGCADTVEVTVTSFGGTSVPGSGSQYTFYDAPNAASVTPGLQVSGQNVTVTGTCLIDPTAVVFSNGITQTPASFVALSPTQILVVVPAVTLGAYSVLVTTPGGTDTTAPPSVIVIL